MQPSLFDLALDLFTSLNFSLFLCLALQLFVFFSASSDIYFCCCVCAMDKPRQCRSCSRFLCSSAIDSHDLCFNCRDCDFVDRCSVCELWPAAKFDDLAARRERAAKKSAAAKAARRASSVDSKMSSSSRSSLETRFSALESTVNTSRIDVCLHATEFGSRC